MPPELGVYIRLGIAVGSQAKDPVAASALVKFPLNPKADVAIETNGMSAFAETICLPVIPGSTMRSRLSNAIPL